MSLNKCLSHKIFYSDFVELIFEKLSESDIPTKNASQDALKFLLQNKDKSDYTEFYSHISKICEKLPNFYLDVQETEEEMKGVQQLLCNYLSSDFRVGVGILKKYQSKKNIQKKKNASDFKVKKIPKNHWYLKKNTKTVFKKNTKMVF